MKALVHSSVADVRVDPDQRSELHSQVLLGDILQVLEKKQKWYYCRLFDGSEGWVHCGYLVETGSALDKYSHADLLTVTAIAAHVYNQPHGNSQVIKPLSAATRVAGITYKQSWHEVEMPDGTRGWLYRHFVTPEVSLQTYTPKNLLEKSERLMGVPYLWGGTSSFAIDCSGFTQLLHRMFHIDLPRNASQQAETGELVTETLGFEALEPGDLLFFASESRVDHVGIYKGEKMMIHAALGNGQVQVDYLGEDGSEYQRRLNAMFTHARRIRPQ